MYGNVLDTFGSSFVGQGTMSCFIHSWHSRLRQNRGFLVIGVAQDNGMRVILMSMLSQLSHAQACSYLHCVELFRTFC
jgi:hypothetical protein